GRVSLIAESLRQLRPGRRGKPIPRSRWSQEPEKHLRRYRVGLSLGGIRDVLDGGGNGSGDARNGEPSRGVVEMGTDRRERLLKWSCGDSGQGGPMVYRSLESATQPSVTACCFVIDRPSVGNDSLEGSEKDAFLFAPLLSVRSVPSSVRFSR